ncbi:HAD-superfamily hydrolase [Wilcoxina mikolae CBS 423.85]|nr:HAD-superfamily hydrolase [Wilcoxina mikolae CBS 423.85]
MSVLATSIRPCVRSLALTSGLSSTVRHLQQSAVPHRQQAPPAAPDFAFAFDIDGVLLHGSHPIPNAPRTLEFLNSQSIEFLLLTNGGGLSESSRVAELSRLLTTPLSTRQFVQSHTPFRLHASSPEISTVLVVGGTGENCRRAAEEYGFSDVLIPADVIASYPGVSPFSDASRYQSYARVLKRPKKVDAVMVFNDPRDWALDIQLIIDLLLSKDGQLGTRRPVEQVLKDGHIPIYFSNPDLWWANEYSLPRLGQGGFRAALEGVWRSVTAGKGELKATTIGKPHQHTYQYAEDVLTAWRAKKLSKLHGDTDHPELRRVYMVGDNPASDIAGANGYKSSRGTEWVSVLVKTGVYRDGDYDGSAKKIVDNVEEAVRWAVEREEGELRARKSS